MATKRPTSSTRRVTEESENAFTLLPHDTGMGPIPVSSPSSTHSDQFDDASEETGTTLRSPTDGSNGINPLEALAMACVAEKDQQQQALLSESTTSSSQISQNDVLCGRGGLTNHHTGNVFFRRLVRIKQEAYLLATKREKAGVAKEIVDVIRHLSPPGRFLKKDPQNPGVWVEIGDRKAREKTSQALREGAPELREELQTPDGPPSRRKRSLSDSARAVLSSMRTQRPRVQQPFTDNSTAVPYTGQPGPLQPRPVPVTQPAPNAEPLKPSNVASSRARVVSDDAGVLGLRPLFHQIHDQAPQTHFVADDAVGGGATSSLSLQLSLPQQVSSSINFSRLAVADESVPQHPGGQEPPTSISEDSGSPITESGCSIRNNDPEQSAEAIEPGFHGERGPRLKLLKSRLRNGM
mmetsp:Transcript_13533/g.23028  ORF Transcript_13533/g.23028 Transcript_13533/m.23028 type:complete len:409 (-) Transcript_13533:781-2007(-)